MSRFKRNKRQSRNKNKSKRNIIGEKIIVLLVIFLCVIALAIKITSKNFEVALDEQKEMEDKLNTIFFNL